MTYDFIIIGGGIVGLATALAFTRKFRGCSIAIIEKENAVGQHQTGHNSGVIHSGLYYKPGSTKAKTCVEGARRMVEFCRAHKIAHDICGKIVLATGESELPALRELLRRGEANGVPGIVEIGPERIREIEPYAAGIKALWVPGTGIVDYSAVAKKYAELIAAAGGRVEAGTRVLHVRTENDHAGIATTRGDFKAKSVINCGGLHSDRIARLTGNNPDARIVPFRGEYYELLPSAEHLVRGLIYPVPDSRFPFLGVHFTRMIGGGVEAGPNAVLAFKREGYSKTSLSLRDAMGTFLYPGFWRMARKYWRTGAGEVFRSLSKGAFVRALQKLVPEIRAEHLKPGGAGVRAQALLRDGSLVDDFRILRDARFVHVLNAPSPAATASLAIGEQIAALVENERGK